MHLIKYNNDTSNYSQSLQEIEPVWVSLSLISVIIFTVVGNSLVCIAVIRERHLQNTTNYFLTSLAFTDCLVACLVMPLAVTVELIGHFPFDALACNVWLTFDVCCCTSSIWHMSVMSLDRYLTLRYPLKYGRNKRRSLVAYKIITIWLISFAICLPLFILGLVDSSNVYNEKTQACFPAHRTFKIYGSFVAFFIPLIIMIVTYTLTMTALQRAHTTKKQRKRGRERIHAVVNLAAMAIRWKRAVNTVEIPTANKPSVISHQDTLTLDNHVPHTHQRKRSSSLFTTENIKRPIFRSSQRLNEPSKSTSPVPWHTRQGKQLKRNEQLSTDKLGHPSSLSNLQIQTKRSRSCAPLLDVENGRKERRRSSSVQTLLQIRRDSAKISEELANLTAQLSAPSANHGSTSKRASLSVPGTSRSDEDDAPTINQLLAEISAQQTLVIPRPFLAVERKKRGRSHSADIHSPIFQTNHDEIIRTKSHVPDLLITRDSIQHIPVNHPESFNTHLTVDGTSQRIKDWIKVAASSTDVNHSLNCTVPSRCASAILVTENTPMLKANKQCFSSVTNLKRLFPRIEQLYGQTSLSNSTAHPSQSLSLMDDHVASVQNFAMLERNGACSTAAPTSRTRLFENRRATKSSSMGSLFLRGSARKHAARLFERISQSSFQMVSLDTDDSSSCTSTLTQHSTTLQPAMAGTTGPKSPKKQAKFKNLSKISANNEHKAMRVLLIIFSIFVILWTPFFAINLLSCFLTNIHPILISTATWLGYCSSCANPIIYTIFSRAFRRAFLNIITCRKVMRSHRSSHSFRQSYQTIPPSGVRKFSSLSKGKNDLR